MTTSDTLKFYKIIINVTHFKNESKKNSREKMQGNINETALYVMFFLGISINNVF